MKKILIFLREHFFLYLKDNFFGALALIGLLVPLVFFPFIPDQFNGPKVALFYILLGIAFCFFSINQGKTKIDNNFFWSSLLFIFGGFISVLFSFDITNSITGTTFRWIGYLFYISIVLFIFALTSALTKERVRFLLNLLIITGLLNAVLSVFQTFGIGYYEGLATFGYLYRAPGLIGNPIFLAAFLVMVVPFPILFFLESSNFWRKIYYSLCIFFLVWAIILTQSRGAMLGLGAVLAVLLMLSFKKIFRFRDKYWIFVILLLFLGLFYLFGNFIQRHSILNAIQQTDQSSINRFVSWEMAAKSINEHPLTGVGFGNYQLIFKQYANKYYTEYLDDAHDLPLQLISTGGIIFFAGFFLINIFALFKLLKSLANREEGLLNAALICSLVGFFACTAFTPVEGVLWLVWAIIISIAFYPTAQNVDLKLAYKYLSAIIGIFFLLYGIYFIVSVTASYYGANTFYQGNYARAKKLLVNDLWINPVGYYNNYYQIRVDIEENKKGDDQIASEIKNYGLNHESYASTHVARSILYLSLYNKHSQQQYFDLAISGMEEALTIDPYFGGAKLNLAYFYYQKGDYVKARETIILDFDETNPNSSRESYLLLANIYLKLGEKDMAIKTLSEIRRLETSVVFRQYIKELVERGKKGDKDFDSILSNILIINPFVNYPY